MIHCFISLRPFLQTLQCSRDTLTRIRPGPPAAQRYASSSPTATLPGTDRQGKCAPHCLPRGRVAVQVSVPRAQRVGLRKHPCAAPCVVLVCLDTATLVDNQAGRESVILTEPTSSHADYLKIGYTPSLRASPNGAVFDGYSQIAGPHKQK